MKRTMKILAMVVGMSSLALQATAQTIGVTPTEIKIGNINPYSGPASVYSTIGKGLNAYFKLVNDQGGVNGRKINFISYDDGYSPPKTVEMARKLVEEDQVALLFQVLGSAPNGAIQRYMNRAKVPQLFVSSSASKWNDPKNYPWTTGFQPNSFSEGRIYAAYVLKNVKDPKIGVLYQNDEFGKDFVNGFEDGLGGKLSQVLVQKQSYEVTDATVESQVVNLKNSGANVFFNVSTPKFAVQAMKKAVELGWRPAQILNSSAASIGTVLGPAGEEASRGVISSLYMKETTDPQWAQDKGFQDWLTWMKKYYPEGALNDQFNAYAYTAAQMMVQVLKQCGNDLSRENIMKQAANLKNVEFPMLLPGIKANTGPDDLAPLEQAQLARFNGKRWELFGDVIDGTRR